MRYARSPVSLTCVGVAFLLVFTASPSARAQASNVPPTVETNAPASEILRAYLEVQAQLQATRFALERNRQEAETAAPRNAGLRDSRAPLLEQVLVGERASAHDSVERSQQLVFIFAGVFVSFGLLAVLLTSFLQWRFTERFAGLGGTLPAMSFSAPPASFAGVYPATAQVRSLGQTETPNARFVGAIGRLEQRVRELAHATQSHRPAAEGTTAEAQPGTTAPSELPGAESRIAMLLGKGQTLLNLDQHEDAVAAFNEILKLDPNHAEALVKKGVALEQLDRLEEAIACYDRALETNRSMTVACLRKGSLCNRMGRYSEALECYEQGLRNREGSHAT